MDKNFSLIMKLKSGDDKFNEVAPIGSMGDSISTQSKQKKKLTSPFINSFK